LNKNKEREHTYEHPEDWVTSCNVSSLRRPRTRARENSPEFEKNNSPGKSQSPPRLTSQIERKEHYEENAVNIKEKKR